MIIFEGRNCHELTHAIGRSAGKYADDVAKEILDCDPVCGVGCHHGIMESQLSRAGTNFENIVDEFCDEAYAAKGAIMDACFHGLGHAIAVYKYDEAESLKVCDRVSDIGKMDCARGVFMELYHVSGVHRMKDIPFDKESWCKSQIEIYQKVCWELVGVLHTQSRSNPVLESKGIVVDSYEDEAIYYCAQAPDIELTKLCYEMMGHNLYNMNRNRLSEVDRVCSRAEELVFSCIIGAIHAVFELDPFGKNGEEVCSLLKDQADNSYCLNEVESRRLVF